MKKTHSSALAIERIFLAFGAMLMAAIEAPNARAVQVGVQYSPYSGNVEISMPASGSATEQRVTGIGLYGQLGSLTLASPVTVGLQVVAMNPIPAGFTAAQMVSYATLSQSSLTFVPSEVFGDSTGSADRVFKNVIINLSIPASAIPRDGAVRSFIYQINTVWPVIDGVVVTDGGYSLSAKVTAAQSPNGGPPVVTISDPSQPVYTYSTGGVPSTLPLAFNVVASGTNVISSVDATINGDAIAIPATNTSGLLAGLGTNLTTVTVPMPIDGAGTYTVLVRGTDDKQQTVSATRSFSVVVTGPAPSVTYELPQNDADFTYYVGDNPVVVANSFTATTPLNSTLQAWTVTLTYPNGTNSGALSTTPGAPSGNSATGSTPLSLSTSGKYTLSVKATNEFSTSDPLTYATATTSFWINRITNPVDQTADASQNALFTAEATLRTDANYTYQWWRKPDGASTFSPLSASATYGNTSGSYSSTANLGLSVAGATFAMSGDQFKLVFTKTGGGTIETGAATLTVRKSTPTIVWDVPVAIVYGTPLSAAQLNAIAKYNGVVVAGTLTYSPSSGVLNAGNQTLNVSFAPADAVNYTSASASVTLAVAKAALTVTADNQTKVYGSANPTLTHQIAGFVNGETLLNSGVTGFPALATSATPTSGVAESPYAITAGPGTLAAANYTFAFAHGQLTVTPAPLLIKANDKTMVQGGAVPALDATYLVLLNGDGPEVISGLSLQTTATSASPPGAYLITVSGGTAANYSITWQNGTVTVTPVTGTEVTIKGGVFFDSNFNGLREAGEPGLGGIGVRLLSGVSVVASTVTAADGEFSFIQAPGTYTVSIGNTVAGLSPTTANLDQTRTFSATNATVDPVGFGLNWSQIRGLKSAALSQGFWKNNVNKALAQKPNGYQVAPEAVAAYTTQIGSLALSPYAGLTMPEADAIFSGKSQLELQLLAAEYNYVSGAWINGSQPLTLAFITWGETVLQNTGNVYNRSYQTFAASWFEAYNTSEGGFVFGPLP